MCTKLEVFIPLFGSYQMPLSNIEMKEAIKQAKGEDTNRFISAPSLVLSVAYGFFHSLNLTLKTFGDLGLELMTKEFSQVTDHFSSNVETALKTLFYTVYAVALSSLTLLAPVTTLSMLELKEIEPIKSKDDSSDKPKVKEPSSDLKLENDALKAQLRNATNALVSKIKDANVNYIAQLIEAETTCRINCAKRCEGIEIRYEAELALKESEITDRKKELDKHKKELDEREETLKSREEQVQETLDEKEKEIKNEKKIANGRWNLLKEKVRSWLSNDSDSEFRVHFEEGDNNIFTQIEGRDHPAAFLRTI